MDDIATMDGRVLATVLTNAIKGASKDKDRPVLGLIRLERLDDSTTLRVTVCDSYSLIYQDITDAVHNGALVEPLFVPAVDVKPLIALVKSCNSVTIGTDSFNGSPILTSNAGGMVSLDVDSSYPNLAGLSQPDSAGWWDQSPMDGSLGVTWSFAMATLMGLDTNQKQGSRRMPATVETRPMSTDTRAVQAWRMVKSDGFAAHGIVMPAAK